MQTKPLHLYSICFPPYDSKTQLHGCLYNIRKNYFENGISEKQMITDSTDGVRTKYCYYISHWGMGWKKMVNDQLLEYSVQEEDGFAILYQDSSCHHYAKANFDCDLDWVQTVYYNHDHRMACSITLHNQNGVLRYETFNPDGTIADCQYLYPSYSDLYSDNHDKLEELSGTPMVYATSSRGEVCFATAQQTKERNEALEEITPEFSGLELDDMLVSTFDWDDTASELFAQCVLLLRGDDPEAEPEEVAQVVSTIATMPEEDVEGKLNEAIAETETWLEHLRGEDELRSYSSPVEQEQDADVAEIMALIGKMEAELPEKEELSSGVSLVEQLRSQSAPGQALPTRYTVAGKKLGKRRVHATEVFALDKVQAG